MKTTPKLLLKLLLVLIMFVFILFQCKRSNEDNGATSTDNVTEVYYSEFEDISNEIVIIGKSETEILTESDAEDVYTTEKMINLEGLSTDFSHLQRVYVFNEMDYDTTMQEMVKLFLFEVLDDLAQGHEDLSFQILEYKNLTVYFSRVVPGVGPQGYEPTKSDTFLEFSAEVDVRYKGYISPVSYFENGSDEFYHITLAEWVLVKEQSKYYLYSYGYYYSQDK